MYFFLIIINCYCFDILLENKVDAEKKVYTGESSKKNNEPRGGGTEMNLRIMLKRTKKKKAETPSNKLTFMCWVQKRRAGGRGGYSLQLQITFLNK